MLIVSNWKAYVEDVDRAKRLFALARRLSKAYKHELVLAPSAPHLGVLSPKNRSKVRFASQDVSAMTGGAHTGEVSAQIISDLGADYAIVGHSERRAEGDTDEDVAHKAQHALAHGLTPILCVGERKRDAGGEYLTTVRTQLDAVFKIISHKERLSVVIAYEPVWAIGKTAADALPSRDLAEMVLYIRKVIGTHLPGRAPTRTKILYGGSVEPENARELAGGSRIDGFLVGHASVEADTYKALVKAVS